VSCAKVLGFLAAGLFFVSVGAMAAEAPKEMKLYVFSSGALIRSACLMPMPG
jgi:N-acyl homoserine lactone hydrolase